MTWCIVWIEQNIIFYSDFCLKKKKFLILKQKIIINLISAYNYRNTMEDWGRRRNSIFDLHGGQCRWTSSRGIVQNRRSVRYDYINFRVSINKTKKVFIIIVIYFWLYVSSSPIHCTLQERFFKSSM